MMSSRISPVWDPATLTTIGFPHALHQATRSRCLTPAMPTRPTCNSTSACREQSARPRCAGRLRVGRPWSRVPGLRGGTCISRTRHMSSASTRPYALPFPQELGSQRRARPRHVFPHPSPLHCRTHLPGRAARELYPRLPTAPDAVVAGRPPLVGATSGATRCGSISRPGDAGPGHAARDGDPGTWRPSARSIGPVAMIGRPGQRQGYRLASRRQASAVASSAGKKHSTLSSWSVMS